MDNGFLAGMAVVVIAGLFSGSFSVPFKFNRGWAWENNWIVWSFTALVLFPWIAALITVPSLGEVYSSQTSNLMLVALFGLVWGVGAITFGLGIEYLGIAIGIPLMMGLNNTVGTLMPIVVDDPSRLLSPEGLRITSGVGLIVAGIIVYSIAGSRKTAEAGGSKDFSKGRSRFVKGLFICLAAGIFGPMVNFAFVYGEPIRQKAIDSGASEVFSSNAVWAIALTAGFVVNFAYCAVLLRRNGTGKKFRGGKSPAWLFAALAGLLWFLSIMLYGMGGNSMGRSGASVGWATMQTLAILTGNVAGIITGEWKGAKRNVLAIMYGGLALMIAGVIVIASSQAV